MKTKKAILEWWKKLGDLTEGYDDHTDFLNKIDESIQIEDATPREVKEQDFLILCLKQKRWKYPLWLYFLKQDCYRIVRF